MKSTFAQTLLKLAAIDDKIFLVVGDLGFGVLNDYATTYPARFLNAGVAEQNMMGVATGLAMAGKTVFTYSIANFPTLRCLEQIRNDVCYHRANVKIVAAGGGFSYGVAGVSHHAIEDLAIMRALPITIVAPGSLWEVEQVTMALADAVGACYLRLDNSYADGSDLCNVAETASKFVLGKARRLVDGDAITLISTGGVLGEVLRAAALLAKDGVNCRVVSMHTLQPLDEQEVFNAVCDTGGIITVEEHRVNGGLGGAVAEVCLERGVIPKYFYRLGIRDELIARVGSQYYLRNHCGISVDAICSKVKELIVYTRPIAI